MDVNEWIMDMDQYINLNNVRGNKKHIFWAFMDTATREMIQEETLSDNDDAAADEIWQLLKNLNAKLTKVREFSRKKQAPQGNVRITWSELEFMSKSVSRGS